MDGLKVSRCFGKCSVERMVSVIDVFSFQAPELCSTATSPIKNYQEEQTQTLTPPGKGPIVSVRSPNCGRQQASVRGARLNSSSSGASGGKNRGV